MTLDNLFTIDLDEKISKITKNRFTEKNFFIIEIIRTALIRSANTIHITNHGKTLTIKDNGKGIAQREILFLKNIFNRNLPPLKREAVIESFIKKSGIGLLSIFAPPYKSIHIKNTQDCYEDELKFEDSNCKYRRKNGKYTSETIISITLNQEIKTVELKKITEKYCSHLSEFIFFNNHTLTSKPLLSDCFLKLKLSSTKNDQDLGELGIPIRENYCSIQLLHKNIPWGHKIFDPFNGLIFKIVIESKRESYEEILHHSSNKVFELYKHMAKNYSQYHPKIKERIEELIFDFCRKSGNDYFLNNFPVFKILDSTPVDSNVIKTISKKEPIFYLYEDHNIKKLKSDKFILILNRKQVDFLINYLSLNLNPYQREKTTGLLIKYKFLGLLRNTLNFFQNFLDRKVLLTKNISNQEQSLIHSIKQYISNNQLYDQDLNISMIEGKHGSPVILQQNTDVSQLYLRKNNKIIKNLTLAITKNPLNVTIFSSLLPETKKMIK